MLLPLTLSHHHHLHPLNLSTKLEKVSKLEAMANMDAYFADPNGWAGRKMRERSGTAPKADYINANQNKGSLALTAVWAVGITGLFVRIFQVQVLGM